MLRPMKRSALNEGTRAEILAELDEYGRDRMAQGAEDSEERAREYARALAVIEAGADEVRVDRAVYRVLPATPGESPQEVPVD